MARSVRRLRRLAGIGELHFYRRGRGKILFNKNDLNLFLARYRQKALDLDAKAIEPLAMRLYFLQLRIPEDGHFDPSLSLALDKALLDLEAAL